MAEDPDRRSERLCTWHDITPLGRGLRFLQGKRWEPSAEEKRALEKIASSSSDRGLDSSQPIVVAWNDEADGENPHNWPGRYRILVTVSISFYSFIVYCGSSIVIPGYLTLLFLFHKNQEVNSLVMSIYVLGYGLGPLLFSPISEVPVVGRNPPYILSFTVFLILTIILGVVENFPAIVALRFFQGFFGSPCLATGGASITDIYTGDAVVYGYVVWVACIYMAPALALLMSTHAVERLGWHWPMWEIAIMAAPTILLMAAFLPETSQDTILLRRARRLRRFTGNPHIVAPSELRQITVSERVTETLVRPVQIALQDPAIGFVCLYSAFIYGIYYCFFEVCTLVYIGMYGMSAQEYSEIFLAGVTGTIIAIGIYILYIKYWAEPLDALVSTNRHEETLLPALPATFGATVGLFLFAWTAQESIHWTVPTLGILIYVGSTFIIFQGLILYIPQIYPRYVASLLTANDVSRSAIAAVLIEVSSYMYRNLGVNRGATIPAAISVLGIVGMWVIWKYGAKLRARSKFAVHGEYSMQSSSTLAVLQEK